MIFVSNTIQYNTIQYNRFKEGAVTPEQGILFGFPTPEHGDKFKMPVAHTRLIKVEFNPPPPPPQAHNTLLSHLSRWLTILSDFGQNMLNINPVQGFARIAVACKEFVNEQQHLGLSAACRIICQSEIKI